MNEMAIQIKNKTVILGGERIKIQMDGDKISRKSLRKLDKVAYTGKQFSPKLKDGKLHLIKKSPKAGGR